MAMIFLLFLAIPTMGYSMAMVWLMLRWLGNRWPREKLASTLIGAFCGLLVGLGSSAIVFLLIDITPSVELYRSLLSWPEILTVDGIVLLWFSLSPLVNAGAGAQIGWRLGKMLEELTLYRFW